MKLLLSKPQDDDPNITNESAGTGSSVVARNVTVHIWQVPLHPSHILVSDPPVWLVLARAVFKEWYLISNLSKCLWIFRS